MCVVFILAKRLWRTEFDEEFEASSGNTNTDVVGMLLGGGVGCADKARCNWKENIYLDFRLQKNRVLEVLDFT